ncbi:MAG: hypothetical protein MUE65_03775 [Methanomassiliicoccales archaeon]|jgi:hypothetical protein|nr:hypothetical protein [Methanomassiliicoccales archaeon]
MQPSIRALLLASAISVLALALLSDPSPAEANDLGSAGTSSGPVRVTCQVLSVQEGSKGWTLELEDGHGGRGRAFLPRSLGLTPPSDDDVVELTLEPSDEPSFFYVRGLVILASSGRQASKSV